jgi:hypothetical protein
MRLTTPSTTNDTTETASDTTSPASMTFTIDFPAPAKYTFAGRSEPVVVIGLAPRSELRIVDADGSFRSVAEHRIRLLRVAS